MIVFSRYLSKDMRAIVDPVIQRNAFFGHSENILVAMLTNERRHIRELASRRIMVARQYATSSKVRQFRVPVLNFAATDYTELISWQDTVRAEPPLTKFLTDEKLQELAKNKTATENIVEFPKFPCHTQATDRDLLLKRQHLCSLKISATALYVPELNLGT